MNRVQISAAARVTPKNVKICDLCGTLNLASNKECWTCRWHGGFSRNEQIIALAWQRLELQYEEVRIEHVTARRASAIGDFGTAPTVSLRLKFCAAFAAWWQHFLDHRDLRMAQREARLRSRITR